MELDSSNDLLDELSVEGKIDERPVFLTVLCILTFVGSALYIVYSLFALSSYNALDDLNATFPSDLDESFIKYMRWMKFERYTSIVGSIGCIIGAVFMLKMKRLGFYLYVISQAAPIVIGFFAANSLGNFFGGFQFISFILYSIFPVGFIILYSLNYKHLK